VLRREGQSIALVMIGGVHYYTGQLFDIETITRVAHEQVQLLIFRIYS
jgi:kynureninase